MSFPAFGSIKTFDDVKKALDRLRGFFLTAPTGNVIGGPTNVRDSNIVEYQGPTGKIIKDGGLTHAAVASAIANAGSLIMLRLREDFQADIEEIRDQIDRLMGRSRENPTFENRIKAIETGAGGSGYSYSGSVADDGSLTLPTVISSAWGFIIAGNDEERAQFTVDNLGTVNLIMASANVVANIADPGTDVKLNIGIGVTTALVIKNRLGSAKNILINYWYN